MTGINTVFVQTLLSSTSFYWTTGVYLGLAIMLSLVGVAMGCRVCCRSALTAIGNPANRPGWSQSGLVTLELVLVLPPLIGVVCAIVQLLWLTHTTLLVHYAAYNAARSARVWQTEPAVTPDIILEHAENAARLALLAAAPNQFSDAAPVQPVPYSTLAAIAISADQPQWQALFTNRAGYAFSAGQVQVQVQFDTDSEQPAQVTAVVTFLAPLTIPLACLLADGKRENGCFRAITAEINLL